MTDLIAADVEVPDFLWNTVKADGTGFDSTLPLAGVRLRGIEPDGLVRPADSADLRVLPACVASDEVVKFTADRPGGG